MQAIVEKKIHQAKQDKKTAILFSGQGSQFTGMGKEYYDTSKQARAVFDEIATLRHDIKEICFDADKTELTKTINAQPALFAVGLAGAFAWCEQNNRQPDCVAGFSLGEIPALVFSKALSIKQGFELVCKRAEYMQECADNTQGSMAAVVGLQSEQVETIVSRFENVWCANFNSPVQTVIAGDVVALQSCTDELVAHKARVIKLNVNGAFHTPFMQKASDKLGLFVDTLTFGNIQIPLYSNIDGKLYVQSELKQRIPKQIISPVKWVDTVLDMHKNGITEFVEVGAGNVLTGLVNKILTTIS